MMLSRELPPLDVAGAPLDVAPTAVVPVRPADEPVQPKAPPVPEPPEPALETPEAATPMLPSAEPSAIVPGDISGATGRAGPVVGAFDRPSAQRSDAARPIEAASAGFSAGRRAARPVHHVQAVQAGGFELVRASPTPAVAAPSEPIETPVEIVFKPTPDYTDEAIALKVQGDIVLEVEFAASGDVRVLRVVSGLGHGLDEAAVRAAARIRFKPATRAGSPVGVRAMVHIVFSLP
jgi:TonB family protein